MAGKPKTIELDVNGVRYEIDDDDPSGRDVRAAAGLNPASSFVLIHVRDRGSTSVGLDDKLDLKAGKVEIFRAFESDRIFTFTLDERAFEWGADSISETELREHGDVSEDKDIVLDGDHDEVARIRSVRRLTSTTALRQPTPASSPISITKSGV